jgi:hypothetical protein
MMRETCEFRLQEKFANLLLGEDEGKRLGDSVRKIVLGTDDPRYKEVGAIQNKLRRKNEFFFYDWVFHRKYSCEELESAVLFELWPTAAFEPTGEMCGTTYDESVACPLCGAGAVQTSDLWLDFRKIPRGKDIARTIADEVIISQRLAEIMMDAGITGFSVRPARHKALYEYDRLYFARVPSGRLLLQKAQDLGLTPDMGRFWVWLNRPEQLEIERKARLENAELKTARALRANKQWPVWHQLVIDSKPVQVAPATRFGNKPFDEDVEGKNRCPSGHLPGLAMLSELFVNQADWDGSDWARTAEFVGTRRGELRPRNMMLVSQKVRKLFLEHHIKGVAFEVAHLV